jgi:hypothetical protein
MTGKRPARDGGCTGAQLERDAISSASVLGPMSHAWRANRSADHSAEQPQINWDNRSSADVPVRPRTVLSCPFCVVTPK